MRRTLVVMLVVFGGIAALTATPPGLGRSAAAATLSVNKETIAWGEPLLITYSVPEGSFWEIDVFPRDGDSEEEGVEPSPSATLLIRDGPESDVWRIDTRLLPLIQDFARRPVTVTSTDTDPAREVYVVRLSGVPEGGSVKNPDVVERRVILYRPVTPAPGTINLDGRERFIVGESIPIRLKGLDEIQDRYQYPHPSGGELLSPELQLTLARLGLALPGGGAEADREIERWTLADNQAGLTLTPEELTGLVPGMYELRLKIHGTQILDSARFALVLPEMQGLLGLTGANPLTTEASSDVTSTYYAFDHPPEAAVDTGHPAAHLVTEALGNDRRYRHYALALYRLGNDGVLMDRERREACSGPHVDAARAVFDGQPAFLHGGFLEPGSYEYRLYWCGGVAVAVDRRMRFPDPFKLQFLLDVRPFEIGGEYPEWAEHESKTIEPEVTFGDTGLSILEPGPYEAGQRITVAVERPAGVDFQGGEVWLGIHRTGGYRFNCHVLEELGIDPDGNLVFYERFDAGNTAEVEVPLPGFAGHYELRLYRNYARRSGIKHQHPFGELLARLPLPVVESRYPGAIVLPHADPLSPGEVIEVEVRLPEDATGDYLLKACRSLETAPGGVTQEGRCGMLAEGTAPGSFTVEIGPHGDPGPYELRLLRKRNDGFGPVLDRLRYAVIDPDFPQYPAGLAFRHGPWDDVPDEKDPLRGIESWFKPKDACEDPVFPQPPDLRVVELYSSDPESADDDTFVPVASVQPGHPVFVEALFSQAPPDDIYRVKVNGERRIRVFRTENPRLYRSRLITLIAKENTP